MITFSKLEKKGHLGNQLFQIASTIGIAIKNNHEYCFPKWSYNGYFKKPLPISKQSEFIAFKEKQFHYEDIDFDSKNYDLEGWFQSEKYFDNDLVKEHFQFENVLVEKLRSIYKDAFEKKTILISIRRGDFVDHPDYFQLPIEYYIQALIINFPDWNESNLILLSDDIEYCKFHFSFLDNVFFANNLSAIEQLALGSLCDDFIISNSTFSWWCAWLGEKQDSKVIRPLHYFTPDKKEKDNDKDYFPERWTIFSHLDLKIKLENTHIVLVKENEIIEHYLKHNFVFDNQNQSLKLDGESFLDTQHNPIFLINDCILPPFAIYVAAQSKKNAIGHLKGSFLNISKYLDKESFQKQFDFGLFAKVLKIRKDFCNKEKILFVSIKESKEHQRVLSHKKYLKNSYFEKLDFIVFNSFSGKINGFFECKYYLKVKKRKLVVFIKTSIKKIIKPKKHC